MAKSKRIFLVDDDVMSLKVGRSILQDHYIVIPVTSGSMLLEMLDKFDADLVLLDIEMPEMDGYQVMRALRANPRTATVPVILLAGKRDDDRQQGFLLGATDYIRKPFSAQLLIKRVEHALLLHQQKMELENISSNVNLIKSEHKRTVEEMELAVMHWVSDLIGMSVGTDSEDKQRIKSCLGILLKEMTKSDLYREEIQRWDVGIDTIAETAVLHDIGKIVVPNNILQKLKALEPDEYEQVKMHTTMGKSMIESLKMRMNNPKSFDLAQTMAFLHHERWDGKGYPLGLEGKDIPLLARTVAIVDVYTALISDRAYKDAVTHEEALRVIEEGKGTQFDPELVTLFLSVADALA